MTKCMFCMLNILDCLSLVIASATPEGTRKKCQTLRVSFSDFCCTSCNLSCDTWRIHHRVVPLLTWWPEECNSDSDPWNVPRKTKKTFCWMVLVVGSCVSISSEDFVCLSMNRPNVEVFWEVLKDQSHLTVTSSNHQTAFSCCTSAASKVSVPLLRASISSKRQAWHSTLIACSPHANCCEMDVSFPV